MGVGRCWGRVGAEDGLGGNRCQKIALEMVTVEAGIWLHEHSICQSFSFYIQLSSP